MPQRSWFVKSIAIGLSVMFMSSSPAYPDSFNLRPSLGERQAYDRMGQAIRLKGGALTVDEHSEKLVTLGYRVAEAILKNKDLRAPVNILFLGPAGSRKSSSIAQIKTIMEDLGLSVEVFKTESHSSLGPALSFENLDREYPDADAIIVESTVELPRGQERIDLYVRFEGDLFNRQERLTEKTGSLEFAQIATSAGVEILGYRDKEPDMLINTDFISLEFERSGGLRKYLEIGIGQAFEDFESLALGHNLGMRHALEELNRSPVPTQL